MVAVISRDPFAIIPGPSDIYMETIVTAGMLDGSGNYVLSSNDNGKTVVLNVATIVLIPSGLTLGFSCAVRVNNTGLNIVATRAPAVMNSPGQTSSNASRTFSTNYAGAAIMMTSADGLGDDFWVEGSFV